MARKKVKLAWISNDATRRATLKKRRKGLLKKVKELSILCDVSACAVVYSPQEPQPELWPSAAETARVLSGFRALPEMEQCKKMMNQESFLRERVSKLHDQLRRHDRESRELESAALLRECLAGGYLDGLRIEELAAVAWVLDHKIKDVQERMDYMRLRENRVGKYYHEETQWFVGQGGGSKFGEQSYVPMVGEGSGGVAADDGVLTAAAGFVEQEQSEWDNLFQY